MESRSDNGLGARMALFMFLVAGLVLLQMWLAPHNPNARKPAPRDGEEVEQADPAPGEGEQPAPETPPGEETPDSPEPAEAAPVAEPDAPPPPEHPRRVLTMGSADPDSETRMLVTLVSQGAGVVRIELNDPKYRALQDEQGLVDRSGYLGHLAVASGADQDELPDSPGCLVEVVGPGTPAAVAGLRPGDRILAIEEAEITGPRSLEEALKKTTLKQEVHLTVARQGERNPLEIPVTLGRHRPMEIVRPENGDPLSFLMTLQRIGEEEIRTKTEDELEDEKEELKKKRRAKEVAQRDPALDWEVDGVNLRTANWEVLEEGRSDTQVTFRMELPKWGLEVRKTYRLATDGDPAESGSTGPRTYHLTLDVEIRNVGDVERTVAYRLDGPTGLPTEGQWYARKTGPGWGMYGMRDVIHSFGKNIPTFDSCTNIAAGKAGTPWQAAGDSYLTYAGVDAHYFSVVMIPQRDQSDLAWFADGHPIRVGGVVNNPWRGKLTNTSFRLTSVDYTLEPGGEPLRHGYVVFAGPKKPELLAEYGLEDTISYGWFAFVARPMLWTLHLFGHLGNYGIAILLLTVLVRGCMFPISRKQALNAQKMQALQPEMKKLAEKYKDDMQARGKAQQELYKKHNFNPAASCLPLFLQLPIFIGLYRSLSVDVELRGAPLLTQSFRWCSNLAAPDMLYDWSGFWAGHGWEVFNAGQGMLYLGPYFNILPLVTMGLMVVQQKMFMPPAVDDQAAMQQKMMKFMMIFMGFIFFKVAAGLCVYFIASSLWGVAERKLLPKAAKASSAAAAKQALPKTRPADRPRPRPSSSERPKPRSSSSNGGAAAKSKKKRKKNRRR